MLSGPVCRAAGSAASARAQASTATRPWPRSTAQAASSKAVATPRPRQAGATTKQVMAPRRSAKGSGVSSSMMLMACQGPAWHQPITRPAASAITPCWVPAAMRWQALARFSAASRACQGLAAWSATGNWQ
jgi:hypothetical protein